MTGQGLLRRKDGQAWLSSSAVAKTSLLLAANLTATHPAQAHSFGKAYTLPVPVWMYLYGSAAALIVSFLMVGYFVNATVVRSNERAGNLYLRGPARWLASSPARTTVQLGATLMLALTICTGFLGTPQPYANFSMTAFWILFVLGLTYVIAITGNIYAVANPWNALCEWAEHFRPGLFAGRFRYPERLAYWPANALYFGFICYELFGNSRPFSLAAILSAYTALNLAAAYLFGRKAWFHYGEFFAVFFRVIGMMAPVARVQNHSPDAPPKIVLRQPFVGLTQHPTVHISLLLFVLFMLSSTAFDGLKSTVPYVRVYWVHVAGLLEPWVGTDIVHSFPLLKSLYAYWQTVILLLSPFLYLGAYLICIALCRWITRCRLSTTELGCRFALTLVPIAFVYHASHYFTLLFNQGPQILALVSDPFGMGWNLFGTRGVQYGSILAADSVWNFQIWLIVAGHIVSLYLAHTEAIQIFGSSRRAALSQIPMLVLMVALTSCGLWILSLPIGGPG